ncbi:hypothetical protein ACWELB_44540 [Streptomyces asiaticus]|uniref:hypothetical protein n=1 Tax=Streptomyces asiaticus TaxID=114695 RepID=UPI003D74436D
MSHSETNANAETNALKQAMAESFFAIIGAPDDEETAARADQVVERLDARLAPPSESAPSATGH